MYVCTSNYEFTKEKQNIDIFARTTTLTTLVSLRDPSRPESKVFFGPKR